MLMHMEIGVLILRVVVGLLFAGHGAQKLFGWFGGQGLAGHTAFMEKLSLRPARFWALVSALGEFLGGLGFAAGLLTPLAAAALIGAMLVAIARVHKREILSYCYDISTARGPSIFRRRGKRRNTASYCQKLRSMVHLC
jgi:uncharacterized membrane protein YphA (DoxX/SURF4 family)